MDGQPPGFFGHTNWPIDEPENDDFHFTSSQTQMLETVLVHDPNYVGQDVHTTDTVEIFNNVGADNYVNPYQQIPNQNSVEDTLFHTNYFLPILQQQQQQQTLPMHASSTSLNEVPAMEMWPGPLNFAVEFSKAQDKTKATPWIFSTKLKKLYVSLDKACPIFFKMDIPPQEFSEYKIRGQIVYSKADHYHDNVERCQQHQGKDVPQTDATPHVLRCDDISTSYDVGEQSRYSILVPLKPPAPGTQALTLCFRFMCLSSCIGSLNRRPTKLIFTLETLTKEAVGRYVCDVRICSCPGRDIRADEGKANESIGEENPSNLVRIELPSVAFPNKGKKKRKAPASITPAPAAHTEDPSNGGDDDTVYNINVNVRGRRQYELMLSTVNNLLHFFENMPRNINDQPDQTNDGKRFKKEQP